MVCVRDLKVFFKGWICSAELVSELQIVHSHSNVFNQRIFRGLMSHVDASAHISLMYVSTSASSVWFSTAEKYEQPVSSHKQLLCCSSISLSTAVKSSLVSCPWVLMKRLRCFFLLPFFFQHFHLPIISTQLFLLIFPCLSTDIFLKSSILCWIASCCLFALLLSAVCQSNFLL